MTTAISTGAPTSSAEAKIVEKTVVTPCASAEICGAAGQRDEVERAREAADQPGVAADHEEDGERDEPVEAA